MSLKRISTAIIATLVISVPLSAVAYTLKADRAAVRRDKQKLKDAKESLSALKKECNELSRSRNPQDFGKYLSGASQNCYDQCKPDSVGGQCPDALFTQLHAAGNLPADVAPGGKIDSHNFVTEVLVGYMNNDNDQDRTLCHDVAKSIRMADEFKINTDSCQQAIASCPFNAKQARLKELAGDGGTCSNPNGGDIASEEQQIHDLQKDIDARQDREDNGCADCGVSYFQDQTQPTGVEKFAMIMGALEPYVGMGLGTYMYGHSLNQYYSAYGNYLNQCSEIGVPCNGPMPMGGGLGIAAALMPGYIGGLNAGLMGMGLGGMGMMSPMMMGGIGMMSPMMMGGMGMMSPMGMGGMILNAGLIGSMGMMSPMGMYGMMSPMMGGMGMMSPMGMGGMILNAGLIGSMGMMSPMGMYGMMSPMGMYGMMSPMGMYGMMSPMGMYGMMSPMGMYGMMSPMMGGMGMMSPMGMYGSIVSAGLIGSMGMMSPMGMYGMMSPMMGGMGMMSPMGMYGMMSPMMGGMGMMSPMGMYGMMSPMMGGMGMMSPMGMYGGMAPYGMYGAISPMGGIGAMGYAIGYPGAGGIGAIGAYPGGAIGAVGAVGSYPGGAIGAVGAVGGVGAIGGMPYGYSPYGFGPGGGYSPYGGGQYSALYLASGYNAMQSALSSQNQQNVMLSQQNLYAAQLRYFQTTQQAGMTGMGGMGMGYSPYMMGGGFGMGGMGGLVGGISIGL